jgi:hypothetical protein
MNAAYERSYNLRFIKIFLFYWNSVSHLVASSYTSIFFNQVDRGYLDIALYVVFLPVRTTY